MESKNIAFVAWLYIGGYIQLQRIDGEQLQHVVDVHTPTVHLDQSLECDPSHTPGLNCGHGHCQTRDDGYDLPYCICDNGWKGLTCDEPKNLSETPTYVDGSHRNYLKNIFQETFKKIKENQGIISESELSGQHSDNSKSPTIDKHKETSPPDACSMNYVNHIIEDRTCTAGLMCKYGVCSSEDKESYIAYTCTCDKGATGVLCETPCCMDCVEQGQCAIYINGTRYCDCKWGLTGDRCQHPRGDTGTLRQIADVSPSRELGGASAYHIWMVLAACVASLLLVTVVLLVVYITWRYIPRSTDEFRSSYPCNNKDSRPYDVLVWYQEGGVTETLVVKQILQELETLSMKVCCYVGSQDSRKETEDILLTLITTSRRVVILCTDGFFQRFSPCESNLLRTVASTSPETLIFIHTEPVQTSRIHHGVQKYDMQLLCGTVIQKYPTNYDVNQHNNFWRHMKTLLSKKHTGVDNTFSTPIYTV